MVSVSLLSPDRLESNFLAKEWMDQGDYMIWHGWQQMLGSSSMGYSEQWSLLEGLLQQDQADMSRRELKELTDRIMKMNKELGAGDDGRVQEVIEESSTTTTTTTTSNITQQQRYNTANDFLQLLNSSGGMRLSLKQAQLKATKIREGKKDGFVADYIEQQALKATTPQHATVYRRLRNHGSRLQRLHLWHSNSNQHRNRYNSSSSEFL